jgi:RNase P subunit RPR2
MYPKILLLLLIMASFMLIWFGLSFFFKRMKSSSRETVAAVLAKKPACPLCSAPLEDGENLRSTAFPQSVRLINERIMCIKGCPHCLYKERQRTCPVCSALLSIDDVLVARMIESGGKISVKIFGCSKCREAPQ